MYKIIYSPKAIEDLQKLKRSEPAAYKKADKFIWSLENQRLPMTSQTKQINSHVYQLSNSLLLKY